MTRPTKADTYGRLFMFGTWAVVLIVNAYTHQLNTAESLFAGWCAGGMMGILFCMTVLDNKMRAKK